MMKKIISITIIAMCLMVISAGTAEARTHHRPHMRQHKTTKVVKINIEKDVREYCRMCRKLRHEPAMNSVMMNFLNSKLVNRISAYKANRQLSKSQLERIKRAESLLQPVL